MAYNEKSSAFFSHGKLDVYRVTLEFLAFCNALHPHWRGVRLLCASSLGRAAESILLNIAEGSGQRIAGNTGTNFFRIALGSAEECAACLTRLQMLSDRDLAVGRKLLHRIAAMLWGLTK